MANNRYVVLNCPAITTGWNDKDYICNTHQMGCGHCQDCTDCVIKQVIQKLREADNSCDGINCVECSGFYMCRSKFANEILQLFDTKEINK